MLALIARTVIAGAVKDGVEKKVAKTAVEKVTKAAKPKAARKPRLAEKVSNAISTLSGKDKEQSVKQKQNNSCCADSVQILDSIDETLKRILYLQNRGIADQKEQDAEKKDTSPGLGGIVEAFKDKSKGFIETVMMGIGLFVATNIKPIVKFFGDAAKSFTDGVAGFTKGVGNFIDGVVKWFTGDDKKEEDKKTNKDGWTVPPKKGTMSLGTDKGTMNVPNSFTSNDYKNLGGPVITTPALSPVKDVIGKAESRDQNNSLGNYNAYNKYDASKRKYVPVRDQELSGMSLKDIMAMMARKTDGKSTSMLAVGRFQYTSDTLKQAIAGLKLSGNEKFTKELQERLADWTLKNDQRTQGMRDYIAGKSDNIDTAIKGMSQVWAGLPKDKSNKSYYSGDGYNKSTVSYDDLAKSLKDSRAMQLKDVQKPSITTPTYAGPTNNIIMGAQSSGKQTASIASVPSTDSPIQLREGRQFSQG